MERIKVTVIGRVQGVGYRAYAQRQAQALQIAGWVRNRPDGSVELEAQGTTQTLTTLLKKLEQGPVLARVARLKTAPSKLRDDESAFTIRY